MPLRTSMIFPPLTTDCGNRDRKVFSGMVGPGSSLVSLYNPPSLAFSVEGSRRDGASLPPRWRPVPGKMSPYCLGLNTVSLKSVN